MNDRGYGASDFGAGPYDGSGGGYGNEYAPSQANPLRAIRRRLWIVALVMVVLAGLAAAVSFVLTPTYRATARVIVVQGEDSTVTANLQSEVIGLQQLTKTMAQGVNSRPVAQAVVERLGLSTSPGELRGGLEARQVAETQFIDISYDDSDPDTAQAVANTTAEVFTEQISDLSPNAEMATTATIWEQAVRPGRPTSPDPVRNVLVALALGLVLGVGLALLIGYLRDDLGSLEETEQISGTPVFGLIPPFKSRRGRRPQLALTGGGGARGGRTAETAGAGGYGYPSERLVTVLEPLGDAAEAYRVLRTNLLHAQVNGEPPKVVTITSLVSAGGSGSICANLGVLLAQAGRRTLIVDGNLREPSLHYIFGLNNARGMVGVLAGDRDPQEAYQEPFPDLGLKLKVLTSGVQPSNPAELLSSGRLPQFLQGVRDEFDYVLVDSPSAGLVSDSAILAAEGDGALLVLDAQQAQRKEVRRAVRGLKAVGAPVIGTVLSNADERGLW